MTKTFELTEPEVVLVISCIEMARDYGVLSKREEKTAQSLAEKGLAEK